MYFKILHDNCNIIERFDIRAIFSDVRINHFVVKYNKKSQGDQSKGATRRVSNFINYINYITLQCLFIMSFHQWCTENVFHAATCVGNCRCDSGRSQTSRCSQKEHANRNNAVARPKTRCKGPEPLRFLI